jgi:NTP pyrophosphatase (non-canonical NTP hydrolase)
VNKQQFLLLKLAEECAEVAQRASKQIQFGKDEKQKDHAPVAGGATESKSNSERLRDEIMDLMVLVTMLEETKEISEITNFHIAYAAKKIKLQKYLDLSASLGQLPEIKL